MTVDKIGSEQNQSAKKKTDSQKKPQQTNLSLHH